MAFLGQQFDATQVDPQQDFEPLPAGEYPVVIIDSDMLPTKRGDGQFLKLTYQVIDGPTKGRMVWERLNLDNPNAQAVEIAQRSLSSICHAIGVLNVMDSQQLHGRPLVIRVEYREPQANYGASNEVKAHKKFEGTAPAQPPLYQQPTPPPQQHPAPAAGNGAPPWAAKPAA